MSEILVIAIEPANYTLDTVRLVYEPRKVSVAYLLATSQASEEVVGALADMSLVARLAFFWRALKTYRAFVINDYTRRINLEFIVLNLVFFRKPFALESDTELRIPRNPLKRAVKWLWLHFLFTRRCCYGFPGGFFEHKKLFEYYGMDNARIFPLPMQVDNTRYLNPGKKQSRRQFRFGYLGRLVPHKNVDLIIAAMKMLEMSVSLAIVGDGDERVRLENLAKDGRVHFSGALYSTEKALALQSFDCLILPSSYEPWGLVVNEALASGVPVIVSDSVGCRHDLVCERADCGATGLVVPTGDVNALAQAMRAMSGDEQLWQTFHLNAEKRMAHWNYDFYGRQFDAWRKAVLNA